MGGVLTAKGRFANYDEEAEIGKLLRGSNSNGKPIGRFGKTTVSCVLRRRLQMAVIVANSTSR